MYTTAQKTNTSMKEKTTEITAMQKVAVVCSVIFIEFCLQLCTTLQGLKTGPYTGRRIAAYLKR